jgi:hypothetical protein
VRSIVNKKALVQELFPNAPATPPLRPVPLPEHNGLS